MAQVVPIEKIQPSGPTAYPGFVRKMKEVLSKQGQIEPLQVSKAGEYFVTFRQDPYAAEKVEAAKQLGWTTMLVVEMNRYEE